MRIHSLGRVDLEGFDQVKCPHRHPLIICSYQVPLSSRCDVVESSNRCTPLPSAIVVEFRYHDRGQASASSSILARFSRCPVSILLQALGYCVQLKRVSVLTVFSLEQFPSKDKSPPCSQSSIRSLLPARCFNF